MTGLTENGRSISVIRNVLPRNSNFAIEHEIQGDRDRRHQQRQPDRGQRLRLGQRGEIGADAFRKGRREHHHQRQHDKYGEESNGKRDDDEADRPWLSPQVLR